jgi:hypothetical protein
MGDQSLTFIFLIKVVDKVEIDRGKSLSRKMNFLNEFN